MKRKRSATTAQHAPTPRAARHASEPAPAGSDQMALTIPHLTNLKPAYEIAAAKMTVAMAFVRSRNIGARRIEAETRAIDVTRCAPRVAESQRYTRSSSATGSC